MRAGFYFSKFGGILNFVRAEAGSGRESARASRFLFGFLLGEYKQDKK